MVCAGKNKLGSAGDRAELSYHQTVSVNGVAVKNIVFFKIQRIIYEIIVDGVRADRYAGLSDDGF